MSFLGSLLDLGGTFFGLPPGIGSAIGGAVDTTNSARQGNDAQYQTNQFNAEQAGINRQFQTDSAVNQRQFQTDFSSTAYQRATADMQKAGLNPMLAYSQGGATSTASGAMPQGSQATASNVNPAAVASAAQAKQTDAQVLVAQAQARNIDTDTRLKEAQIPYTTQLETTSAADAELKGAQSKQTLRLIDKIGHEINNIGQDTILKQAQGNGITVRAQLDSMVRGKVSQEIGNLQLTAKQIEAMTSEIAARAINEWNKVPTSTNQAAAAQTDWGKNVTPWLPDIQAIGGTAAQLFRAATPWGKAISLPTRK
jgi:hypothetical protein